jgi:NAD(P)-dependent dehydrogenase (short-subunit alcohol dehydrogenase family)
MNRSSKNALVTGAAKRIGAEIVKSLVAEGWNVVIHYHNSEDAVNNLICDLAKYEANSIALKCDFNKPDELESFFENAVSKFGEFSLLINNAAAFTNDKFNDFSIESLTYNNNVNFIASAVLINKFFKQNIFNEKNKGNIINILDYCIYSYPENFYSYTLSKMAQKNLIDVNAKLLAPFVRINGIALGSVLKADKQLEENFIKSYKQAPLQTFTKITEILDTIKFILNSNTLTGAVIPLDSGKRYTNDLFI